MDLFNQFVTGGAPPCTLTGLLVIYLRFIGGISKVDRKSDYDKWQLINGIYL